ncbi:ATP-binding protein [Paenarthrobacter sp. JL.01a]|uniref:ATP-binding protein n=1 Tax=Paenarthrobacter sp. JL.01a TaxID=2979324 RepID=UPI0021C80B8A|nr:ATP-binding protein [Paenarthrobacter sp. JL.01a]UXM91113.1 ATP-binding protein [Paenarthrobacter sp. JL.01a]
MATIERHHRRTSQLRPFTPLLDNARIDGVINWLVATETAGQQILLLHGDAGSGKSTLVDSVLERLSVMGWFCGVLSMDRTSPGIYTSAALGEAAALSASPAVLLSGVSDSSPAALFIDQLDAVATYSGRMQDNYDAVDEVLAEAAANPNLRLVLVVRTVDLEEDPRLGRLRADKERVSELRIDRFTPAQVAEALDRSGVDPKSVDAPTLKLLEVPLHYAIFSRLDASERSGSFSTLPDLYERFTVQTTREVRARVGSLDWHAITGRLVTHMSQNEVLRAPAAILRSADPAEVDALISSGVLFKESSTLSFFHETYFDYLFAEAFVADGGDLEEFLVESGQALFRRAQTRQILEYLAKTNRQGFLSSVVSVLSSQSIRSHLLDIPLVLLRQWDATAEDWQAVRPLAFGPTRRSRQLLGLLSSPAWFDAADTAGDWEAMLADEEKLALIPNQLISAARVRPERVAQLVKPHVGQSDLWKSICVGLVTWSLSPGLAPLTVELLEGGHVDGVRGPIAVNSDFWSILYSLAEEAPPAAARVVGAYLRRATALSLRDGVTDPFDSGHLPNSSSSGGEDIILKVASGAPEYYVAEVLPFVTRVLADASAVSEDGGLLHGTRWHYRFPGEPLGIDDALFFGLETALRTLAAQREPGLLQLLRPLMTSELEELRFLSCRALATSSMADESIQWLSSDTRNLDLGYMNSSRWASRELIESATKTCDSGLLKQLSDLLLSYYTDYERSPLGRRSFGFAQYELLSGIDRNRRSTSVNRRLQELERKFENRSPAAPLPVTAEVVGAPVPESARYLLTDAQWIEAIHTHESDTVDWSHHGGPRGGIRELSALLGQQTADEPTRFANLALSLDNPRHAAHVGSVIRSAAGKIPIELFSRLCVHGRQLAGQNLGRDICAGIRDVAPEATDDLIELIISCSSDDDPARETAGAYNGDLSMAGLNCTRGAAAGCLARVLFTQPRYSALLLETVRKLARDPILAVKVRTAEAILALFNTIPDEALDIAESMFDDSPAELFDARETTELLKHACLRRPKTFARHLCRALLANESTAKRAGYPWIVAYVNGALETPAPKELSGLSAAARSGVAKSLFHSPGAALDVLIQLLNDEDSNVRKSAARAVRNTHEVTTDSAELLVHEFVQSPAFPEHMENLFASLDRSRVLLPLSTIEACERAVDVKGPDLGDIRLEGALISTHLIAIVLRLYKQGNAEIRDRCLDVIDKLSDIGAYGLEGSLDDERV